MSGLTYYLACLSKKENRGMMMNKKAVTLNHVTKTYGMNENVVQALQSVDVMFTKGSFTAIMGPSGSGKSTLLQIASGLEQPTSGTVKINDIDISDKSDKELTILRRSKIGFIFQSFNLVSSLTAAENVMLPGKLAGKAPKRSDVLKMLKVVGLEHHATHLPSQLSGGQQQRVAIARALITNPSVIFADEPTGALDSSRSKEIMELLRSQVDKNGQTIIMVTHDPVAASYADRVIFLVDGAIVYEEYDLSADKIASKMLELGEGQ